MYKNIALYIVLSLLISVVCSFVIYCVFYNPFSLSDVFLLWMLRVIVYILFAWWLFRLGDRFDDNSSIGWLSVIIPAIAILTDSSQFQKVVVLFDNQIYQKSMCYFCYVVVAAWVLNILFSKGKTLLGFLVILNTIITIFIVLPYGIPRVDINIKEGLVVESYNFSCFPYFTFSNYRPFMHQDNSKLYFFLDIRVVAVIVFIVYEILHSAIQTTKIKYSDNLEKVIKETENSIQQFFKAGGYFVWNIIRRFFFFTKSFWSVFRKNIWRQIENSIESYIYALYLFFAFFIPLVIFKLAILLLNYIKTTTIIIFSFDQIIIGLIIIFLFLFPLLLVKLLNSDMKPFELYNFKASERPSLFLPIYITFLGIGLTSIISCFVEKSYGLYLILFFGAIVYAGVWGYNNFSKVK